MSKAWKETIKADVEIQKYRQKLREQREASEIRNYLTAVAKDARSLETPVDIYIQERI